MTKLLDSYVFIYIQIALLIAIEIGLIISLIATFVGKNRPTDYQLCSTEGCISVSCINK